MALRLLNDVVSRDEYEVGHTSPLYSLLFYAFSGEMSIGNPATRIKSFYIIHQFPVDDFRSNPSKQTKKRLPNDTNSCFFKVHDRFAGSGTRKVLFREGSKTGKSGSVLGKRSKTVKKDGENREEKEKIS